jgi:phage gp45-like
MNRNSLLEMSGRAMHQAVRFTLNKGMDQLMMQELHFDGMNSDGRDKVERVQNYGFSSTPLPRDVQEGAQKAVAAVAGAVGGSGGAILGAAAEGIAMFMGGQRNHPVVIGVDDRRHRPMGLLPGENAQYDDIGQMTLLRRGFMAMLSLDSIDQATGKMVERFASLRHVKKEKQKRPTYKPSSGGQSGGGATPPGPGLLAAAPSQTQQAEAYKHEGESVNTEVRCTKDRIEFRAGDTVVGYYEASSQTWFLKGKIATMEFDKHYTTVTDRLEVIGTGDAKIKFGLDQKDEDNLPKVSTVGGPAKKVYAKVV